MFMEPEGKSRDVGPENLVNLIFLSLPGAVEFVANGGKIRRIAVRKEFTLSKL